MNFQNIPSNFNSASSNFNFASSDVNSSSSYDTFLTALETLDEKMMIDLGKYSERLYGEDKKNINIPNTKWLDKENFDKKNAFQQVTKIIQLLPKLSSWEPQDPKNAYRVAFIARKIIFKFIEADPNLDLKVDPSFDHVRFTVTPTPKFEFLLIKLLLNTRSTNGEHRLITSSREIATQIAPILQKNITINPSIKIELDELDKNLDYMSFLLIEKKPEGSEVVTPSAAIPNKPNISAQKRKNDINSEFEEKTDAKKTKLEEKMETELEGEMETELEEKTETKEAKSSDAIDYKYGDKIKISEDSDQTYIVTSQTANLYRCVKEVDLRNLLLKLKMSQTKLERLQKIKADRQQQEKKSDEKSEPTKASETSEKTREN